VKNEVAQRWGKKMAELDGYLFVTAEYNRSITGALKNALDWAYREYNRKPAAYLGYGGVGGARAVEQLRLINVELQMAARGCNQPSSHRFADCEQQGRCNQARQAS
jgi:NAD(P)H-dependent FMN reductase